MPASPRRGKPEPQPEPGMALLLSKLRVALPHPWRSSTGPGRFSPLLLSDLVSDEAWAAVALNAESETPSEAIREGADRILEMFFDGGRPGGSWNTELVSLPDGPNREFVVLLQDDQEPGALARLEAGTADGLRELMDRFVVDFLGSGEHAMYFPADASGAVSDRALQEGLLALLKWQNDFMGGYESSGALMEAPPATATDDELRQFVEAFLSEQ